MSAAEKSAELTKEQLLEYVKKQRIKVKKLEAEVTSLKAEKDSATNNAAASSTGTDDAHWQTKVQEQQDLVSDLQVALKARDDELQRRDAELLALKKQHAEAETATAEERRVSSSYVETAQQLEAALGDATARCEQLAAELASTAEDFAAFKQHAAAAQSDLNEKLTEKDKECAQLQLRLQQVEEQMAASNGDTEKLAASDELIGTLQMQLKNVSAAKEALADQAAQSAQEKQALEQHVARIEEDLSHVQQQAAAVTRDKAALEEKLQQVQQEMEEARERAAQAAALEKQLQDANESTQQLLQSKQSEAEAAGALHLQQLQAVEERVAALTGDIADRDARIEKLQAELAAVHSQQQQQSVAAAGELHALYFYSI